jgi:hypothetical protein
LRVGLRLVAGFFEFVFDACAALLPVAVLLCAAEPFVLLAAFGSLARVPVVFGVVVPVKVVAGVSGGSVAPPPLTHAFQPPSSGLTLVKP